MSRQSPSTTRRFAVAAALVPLIALVGCGDGDSNDEASGTADNRATTTAAVETPSGVIAIGHSGLTGENSDPNRPGQEARENSWATGTNPEVDSIYQRLIAVRPETEGHVANTAQAGAPAALLAGQAEAALAQVPAPALVIIQTIDGDITCDGIVADNVAEFGASVAEALDVIQATSPSSRILMVGQLGRPDPAFLEELVSADPTVKPSLTGTGPCDFFDPAGDLVEENLETLTRVIDSYEAEQERLCAAAPHCRTDGGARAAYVDELENFTSDWNHLNVRGSARAAEIVWPAVLALLELS
jgi:hypothetical protein